MEKVILQIQYSIQCISKHGKQYFNSYMNNKVMPFLFTFIEIFINSKHKHLLISSFSLDPPHSPTWSIERWPRPS